ncbi:3-dehydrosphinganine reductase [Tieghemiomyces parasiticus]|uniref:3-dehydrosphinganine reductase n=1 Tax=Tieghemiomyces parasiticus TaxID=78921 RepID=A0A9W7ZV81_9FUNG|nr:3-dehydrosphinganine reductase [Tieghemiomyces parasiticus]
MDGYLSCTMTTVLGVLGAYGAWYVVCAYLARRGVPPLNFKDKHCYVTGGSAGLGEQLAVLLVEAGAHVTIVARNQTRLDEAQRLITAHRRDERQRVVAVSADVSNHGESVAALDRAIRQHDGQVPEYVFACAGTTTPRYFLDYGPGDFERTMQINYFGALYTIQQAVKYMVQHGVRGRIVTVSSQAGLVGIPGYSEYAPTKAALRMLTETLYYELSIYGIVAHCFFPANIKTPGFEHENQTKPRITRVIDGEDEAIDPRVCAQRLLRGMDKGYPFIVSDPLGDVVRAACKGVGPANNMAVDTLFAALGWFAVPLWRAVTWWQVRDEVQAEATQRRAQLS